MKKIYILLLIVLFLVLSIGYSQESYYANQVTVEWDAVSVDSGSVSYNVYIELGGNITKIGDTVDTNYTITFTEEGKYNIGVSAVRTVDDEVLESDITWSNIEGVPNPFDVKYYIKPSKPANLKLNIK